MKELMEIAEAWDALRRQGKTAALATVVRVDGSAYRRPGARMLIGPDGQTLGSVSGGCLEADVVERARQVLATSERAVVTYDTTEEGDSSFGVGLGCQGVIQVLIEPLSVGADAALALAAGLVRERGEGVFGTVYAVEPGGEVAVGDRMLLTAETPPVPNKPLQAEAERVRAGGRSVSGPVALDRGFAEIFWEYLQPPPPLVLFGAGPDASPLTRLAKELGWHVTVIDHRPAFASQARFPQADTVLVSARAGLPEALRLDERTAVVIMTHNYQIDRSLLAQLLPSPVGYLGMLGPRRRTQGLLAELHEEGLTITDSMMARLHGPVGLDIGAETPEQIALAIVAEIQARMAGRTGGFLRERPGPIYGPAKEELPRATGQRENPPCALSA